MKSFAFFSLTIFLIVITAIAFTNLDPGVKGNLNTNNVITIFLLIFASVFLFYFFLISFFNINGYNPYHTIRAILLSTAITGTFILKIISLLTVPVFIIILIIYILSEITLFEVFKK